MEGELAALRTELAAARDGAVGTDDGTPDARPIDDPTTPAAPPSIEVADLEPDETTTPRRAAEVVMPSADEQAVYDDGYALFHRKAYDEAEAAFQAFLDRFPRSDLADNALYWIGESRFARTDFDGALEAFSATVERYPDGNKVPDAMLKAGRSLEALGDRERAFETYEEVRSRFPGSGAAAIAADLIAASR